MLFEMNYIILFNTKVISDLLSNAQSWTHRHWWCLDSAGTGCPILSHPVLLSFTSRSDQTGVRGDSGEHFLTLSGWNWQQNSRTIPRNPRTQPGALRHCFIYLARHRAIILTSFRVELVTQGWGGLLVHLLRVPVATKISWTKSTKAQIFILYSSLNLFVFLLYIIFLHLIGWQQMKQNMPSLFRMIL